MIKHMKFLKVFPCFIFLLPLFFFLHGFFFYYDSVPLIDAAGLFLKYLFLAVAASGIFWLFYRDLWKASIIGFFAMAYFFFFGNVQDVSKYYLQGTFFVQYRFVLPFS